MAIERLTAEDQLMLAASGRWPQDIGALALLEGGHLLDAAGLLRIDAVRAAIRSRLHLAPRFRQVVQVPGRGLGPPLWVDDPAFDLDDHVRVLPVPAPGGEAELLAAVERLRRRPLERSRPLWQLWFLTGLAEGRVGLYVKLHHAVDDGMATMATMARFLDPVADPPAAQPPPWAPAPGPTAAALLADNLLRHLRRISGALATFTRPRAALRRLRRAWPATREVLVGAPPPATSLDRLVGPDRSLALVRTTLDQVREIAHGNDATVNDVLLALTADGLRALLQRRGEPVEDTTVRIWVPVSLRRRGPDAPGDHPGPLQGNLVAQMVVPLPLGGPHPGRRLRRIAAETALRKARVRSSLGTLFGGRVMRRLLLPAVIRQRVNVTSASIPGPTGPRYLAGARVLEVFPVLPLIGNVTLGVGALSYAGTFTIGVVADRAAYPDLEVFAPAVRAALRRQEVPA